MHIRRFKILHLLQFQFSDNTPRPHFGNIPMMLQGQPMQVMNLDKKLTLIYTVGVSLQIVYV